MKKVLIFVSCLFVLCLFTMCGKEEEEVKDVAITAISIPASVNDMAIAGTVEVTATVTPEKATGSVSWSSSTANVTVAPKTGTNGRIAVITAVSAGTAKITASSGSIKSSELSVTVKSNEVPITAITITASVPDMELNATVEVEATVTPNNATGTVEWVAVDGTGKVTVAAVAGSNGKKATITAVSAGTAQVYAKSGTVESGKLSVTVKKPQPANDYASEVEGTYHVDGELTDCVFFPALNGPLTDAVISLERVDNGTLDMEITANIPALAALGGTAKQVFLSTLTISSDYELTGTTSMPNPIDATSTLNFDITGKADPTNNTITLNLVCQYFKINFTSAPLVDIYYGEGELTDCVFFPALNGPIKDVVISLEKVDDKTLDVEITANIPALAALGGNAKQEFLSTLTVSSDNKLTGTTSMPNPIDATSTLNFDITGTINPKDNTIVLNLVCQYFKIIMTAEKE